MTRQPWIRSRIGRLVSAAIIGGAACAPSAADTTSMAATPTSAEAATSAPVRPTRGTFAGTPFESALYGYRLDYPEGWDVE